MSATIHFIAHRGWQENYPENSLLAIQAAIEAGVKHVECDIQLSKDLKPILCHDQNLQRLSGVDEKTDGVHQLSAEQIQQIACFEPERLGRRFIDNHFNSLSELTELMERYPNVTFYIELKEESIACFGRETCLAAVAEQVQHFKNAVFLSFDAESVALAKSHFGFKQTAIVLRGWASRENVVRDCYADLAYISKRRLPPNGRLELSVPLAVYEIPELDVALALIKRGVDMIESYRAPSLLKAFKQAEPG